MENDNGDGDQHAKGRSTAEWTTLAVSLLIVAALIGAALVEQFWFSEPPGVRLEVTLSPEQTRHVDDVYYVPFTVKNIGSDGAENVSVAFTVKDDGQTLQESTIEIAFLANSGSAQGELVTEYDPATHQVDAQISTFETP
jgi:uncharacterized protein (TIGR02588 family)